jgi:hypothetical protein
MKLDREKFLAAAMMLGSMNALAACQNKTDAAPLEDTAKVKPKGFVPSPNKEGVTPPPAREGGVTPPNAEGHPPPPPPNAEGKGPVRPVMPLAPPKK